MKILVIGGCHAGGYGIQSHLGFARQWAAHLEIAAHEPVHVQCLTMVKLQHVDSLLTQYASELQAADLVVLQLGHHELSWRKSFFALFASRVNALDVSSAYKGTGTVPCSYTSDEKLHKATDSSRRHPWKDRAKLIFLQLYKVLGHDIPLLQIFRSQLTTALDQLVDYRKKIILLTPFPSLNSLDHWLRKQCHDFIVDCAMQRSFIVADTHEVIPRHQTFFLADGAHLNSMGHMLLALFLSELPCVLELHNKKILV